MWNTPSPVSYPSDPNQVFWGYTQGTDLRDNSIQDLANYYKRLVCCYTLGGFYDEYGIYHRSGYHYNIPMWEILNEVQSEHAMSAETYTRIYDAIAQAIQEVQPKMQFVGLALSTRDPDYLAYFVNSSNHVKSEIPLEWVSYHFYASPDDRTVISEYPTFFSQADKFFEEVAQMEKVRKQLAPWVKTTIDEIGVILPGDGDSQPAPVPDIYWNAAGAMFAYIFGNLIPQGIDVLGESQLVGYPSQYPSVSMMDWVTAKPNSRYWVLYLLHKNFHVGDKLVRTTSSDTSIYAQGFLSPNGKTILIINKSLQSAEIAVQGNMTGGILSYVDITTFEGPPASIKLTSNVFTVSPFAVAVVSLN